MNVAECRVAVGESVTSAQSVSALAVPLEKSVRGTAPVSAKIHPEHLAKLAIVYVRQSSPHQVRHHRESRERQYGLANHAAALGWPQERVLMIDEDQGQSGKTADHRNGFHRLLSEVTMDHVGLVLGIEMSRLARSNKDWHQLLELCAVFGAVLADEEGVYDPNDSNDRLLLGLKGTISEFELVTMRNRLDRGRLNKAQRGEMFHAAPLGYVISPNGQIAFDPDEQAQSVVRLIFAKFDELGSLYATFHYLIQQGIQLPIRVRCGANKGELEWHRPNLSTLSQMMGHPLYAGAYAYGRRPVDPNRRASSRGTKYRPWKNLEDWKVLLKDRWPAYITWDHYLQNQERLKQNRSGPKTPGTPRRGLALLPGLVVCGTCGRRMGVNYPHRTYVQYHCKHHYVEATPNVCPGLSAQELDQLVAQQVLRALEPASVELSLQAQADLQRERDRLHQHWDQTLRRAHYDAELSAQRYRAVDPANRLVAATLEADWEAALRQERQRQDDYDRFQRQTPRQLSHDEREQIASSTSSIATLWSLPATTNKDRQAVVRCLVERVVVQVRAESEHFDATIHWAGGYTSQHELIRPVGTYAQLRDFEALMRRVTELRESGHTAGQIAKQLNADGFHPPKCRGEFNEPIVRQLLIRRGLMGQERSHQELLGQHEWWLADLARHLQTTSGKLTDWARRGWINSRRTPIQHYWILWADNAEIERLRQMLAHSQRGLTRYPIELITPKPRPPRV